jgi:hypothetical protein
LNELTSKYLQRKSTQIYVAKTLRGRRKKFLTSGLLDLLTGVSSVCRLIDLLSWQLRFPTSRVLLTQPQLRCHLSWDNAESDSRDGPTKLSYLWSEQRTQRRTRQVVWITSNPRTAHLHAPLCRHPSFPRRATYPTSTRDRAQLHFSILSSHGFRWRLESSRSHLASVFTR